MFFCVVWVVGGEEFLEIFWFGVTEADDCVLVDEQGDGDGGDAEVIEWVCEDGPVHLLPLHVEGGAVWVLFLDDACDVEFA